MPRKAIIGGLLAVLATSGVAHAQRSGTIEAGAFFRYGWFDYLDNIPGIKSGQGVGVRLGFFPLRNLELEADGAFVTSANSDVTPHVTSNPIHARLVYNFPVAEHGAIVLGGGYTHNEYHKDFVGSDNGVGGLVGIRLGLGGLLSIRLDGTADYMHNPAPAGVTEHWNFGAQAGLSLMWPHGRKAPGDADHDGIRDDLDQCPATPAGDQVDGKGCTIPKPAAPAPVAVAAPVDADHDGVMDNVDQCLNTPAGDAVDAKGCSLPKDADADGVVDSLDKCPATPKGDKVDASGCTVKKDADGDGVADDIDKCPATPGGTVVDAVGCPKTVLFTPGTTQLVLKGVNFATNKSNILPTSFDTLNSVAQSIIANPGIKIEVQGHTDSRGSAALNARLSQARADAVRQYLLEHGVPADQLVAKGYGPGKPIAPNTTAAGRAKNRRVELDLIQ
ncbi:MAG: OmpA family protein [Gemmatimonadota bacterium]